MAPTLHEAVRLYGQWRVGDGGYSTNTWAGEAPGLLAFADYATLYGIERFDQLTEDYASDWWKDTRARLGDQTAPTRLHQLRSFLTWAARKGWLVDDPTLLIRAGKPQPRLRERLTARELLDMIAAADYPQHRIILALAANLGLRRSEIRSLRIADVNLALSTIRVTIHKTKDVDDMPITTELGVELARWLAHYRQACPALTPQAHLVPSQRWSNLTKTMSYYPTRSVAEPEEVVKRALSKLGWGDVVGEGVHTVRRSMARIFFDAAEADESYHEALLGTMRLLHHDRAETTLRYIGVDRQTQARDRFLKGCTFLSRLAAAEAPELRAVTA